MRIADCGLRTTICQPPPAKHETRDCARSDSGANFLRAQFICGRSFFYVGRRLFLMRAGRLEIAATRTKASGRRDAAPTNRNGLDAETERRGFRKPGGSEARVVFSRCGKSTGILLEICGGRGYNLSAGVGAVWFGGWRRWNGVVFGLGMLFIIGRSMGCFGTAQPARAG